jgi:Ca2+-binding RTX toxin-like protein
VLITAALALAGVAQAKNFVGTGGHNRLVGTARADMLKGKGGKDVLIARAGTDRLFGGPGRDTLRGGPGRDEFNTRRNGYSAGGQGNDRIFARDHVADLIDCGGGFDTVIVDKREDGVYNCEIVREPS